MAQMIQLNFHRLCDAVDTGRYITVSTDDTIQNVIGAIDEQHRGLKLELEWQPPYLYQTDRSDDDLPGSVDQLDQRDTPLKDRHRVDRYWPDASKIDEERVHLLLNVTAVRPIGPKRPQDDLADLPSTFRNMQLQQNNTAKWFQNCKPPSETARPSTYMEQQNGKVAPILNGRPYACTGLPVQLFHPVFDHFLRALEASDEPSASDYKNVQMLAFTGQDVYRNEGDRWKLLLSRFLVALDSKIARDHPVQNCKPDGLIQFFSTELATDLYCSIIEIKNEVGTGACDPGIQAAEDYGICWSQGDVSSIRGSCCCPSLLIAVAGPWMCILGAVYLDHVVVQQLTDYVWLGHHPQQEIHLRRLTRLFCAARDSIVQLSNYYASISGTPPRPPDRERFFPHVRQYSTPGGGVIAFSYTGFIDTPTKPVFTAVTESGKDIVVKFAERYNIEAHRTLADKALAPAILSYEPPTHSRGFHCIIMERVQSVSLHRWYAVHTTKAGLQGARKDVQTALDTLHSRDWVFGDLRTPNVLVIGEENSTHGMLVDFDWCGQNGVARYPATMNDDLKIGWPEGAERRSIMMKEHDLYMFKKLFK
ncbi:adaptin amino-terminal region protein [Ceratobasidium sp. AG-Ba]|nr:adaptin amino-terminal region protein [Ceratobasidium sp. AG-Ba]